MFDLIYNDSSKMNLENNTFSVLRETFHTYSINYLSCMCR